MTIHKNGINKIVNGKQVFVPYAEIKAVETQYKGMTGKYTSFGFVVKEVQRVVEIERVDKIEQTETIEQIEIIDEQSETISDESFIETDNKPTFYSRKRRR